LVRLCSLPLRTVKGRPSGLLGTKLVAPDGSFVNFDARAAGALGFHFGSPIRITATRSTADGYFLRASIRIRGTQNDA
jgi:hypothetical protein